MSSENLIASALAVLAFFLAFVSLNHLTEYAFFTILIIWALSKLKDGMVHWTRTSLDLPIGLLLIWILITLPWASNVEYSFGEWRKTVANILMFYLVIHAIKEYRYAIRILFGLFAGIAVVSLLEAGYFFQKGGSIFTIWPRGGNLTGSSQWLSVYVVIGLPGLIFFLERSSSWWVWIYFVLYAGAIVLGILVCNTRATWIAVGVQMLVIICLKYFRQGWVPLLGSSLVVGMVMLALLNPGKYQGTFSFGQFTSTSTMERRLITWTEAFKDIKEHPVVGLGYGKHSFSQAHPELKPPMHSHVHNTFLSKAVQIGIPGFFFFIWIISVVLKKSYDILRGFSSEDVKGLALVIHLMMVGLIVRNLFDDMWLGTIAYLFWLLTGLLFCLNNRVKFTS